MSSIKQQINQEKEMHAWFSMIQKSNILDPVRLQHCKYHKLHTNIYLTDHGKEVEVTEVLYNNDSDHHKRFQDSRYIGKVVKWLRPCYN